MPRLSGTKMPEMGARANWSREQLKLAFHFYCQTPFGKLHSRNPEIILLAKLIGRTPDALAMKLVNFASLDPSITSSGRSGLKGASKLDREIWDEFNADWEGLAVESERLRQQLFADQKNSVESTRIESDEDETLADFSGETRAAVVQLRVKQQFFRRAVLSSYRGRCCISGVSDPRLLVASHIVPWRTDDKNRLNPSNGLCLSALHDKAFDNHLFTLTEDLRILLSKKLKATPDQFLKSVFFPAENRPIEVPEKFVPDKRFLEHHRTIARMRDE